MRRVGAPEVPRGRNAAAAAWQGFRAMGAAVNALRRRALPNDVKAAATAWASNLKLVFPHECRVLQRTVSLENPACYANRAKTGFRVGR
jgi:hypothetical protein